MAGQREEELGGRGSAVVILVRRRAGERLRLTKIGESDLEPFYQVFQLGSQFGQGLSTRLHVAAPLFHLG